MLSWVFVKSPPRNCDRGSVRPLRWRRICLLASGCDGGKRGGGRRRVRQAFATAVYCSDPNTIGVLVSVGLAAAPAERCDLPSLLVSADRALYRAEAAGRDRIVAEEQAALDPRKRIGKRAFVSLSESTHRPRRG